MNSKHQTILTIVIVLVLFIYGIIFKAIPEYQKNQGSSDKLFMTSKYDDVIEFKINNQVNFAIITKDKNVIHLLIFDERAISLYNQNIENQTIKNALGIITTILINNSSLTDYSTIELTKYIGTSYSVVKNNFNDILKQNNLLNMTIRETESTLEEKANELKISVSKNDNIITKLDMHSKEIINKYKNSEYAKNKKTTSLNQQKSLEYANNVYQKLENYVITNNIGEQDINSTVLPITFIPADESGKIFPSSLSWYYVKDYKVYAYIVFESNDKYYDFCFQGVKESKKGEC